MTRFLPNPYRNHAPPRPGARNSGGLRARRGFTLPELLIVVVVVGILLSVGINRLRGFGNELENATRETASYLRLVRGEAMATTSAYRIVVAAENELRVEFARGCGSAEEDWESDQTRRLLLRDGVVFAGSEATVDNVLLCFNSRGVADRNPVLTLTSVEGDEREIEALIGGGILVTGTGD